MAGQCGCDPNENTTAKTLESPISQSTPTKGYRGKKQQRRRVPVRSNLRELFGSPRHEQISNTKQATFILNPIHCEACVSIPTK